MNFFIIVLSLLAVLAQSRKFAYIVSSGDLSSSSSVVTNPYYKLNCEERETVFYAYADVFEGLSEVSIDPYKFFCQKHFNTYYIYIVSFTWGLDRKIVNFYDSVQRHSLNVKSFFCNKCLSSLNAEEYQSDKFKKTYFIKYYV